MSRHFALSLCINNVQKLLKSHLFAMFLELAYILRPNLTSGVGTTILIACAFACMTSKISPNRGSRPTYYIGPYDYACTVYSSSPRCGHRTACCLLRPIPRSHVALSANCAFTKLTLSLTGNLLSPRPTARSSGQYDSVVGGIFKKFCEKKYEK